MAVDILATIQAKSNQLNAIDLLGRSLTIEITNVSKASAEQPVAVNYVGDDGKPFYPCKTVRRIMVRAWGDNAASYIGRKMTLYHDPDVIYAGAKVGGIRVSHMSHISEPVTIALAESKLKRKVHTIQPIVETKAAAPKKPEKPSEPPTDELTLEARAMHTALKALKPGEREVHYKSNGGDGLMQKLVAAKNMRAAEAIEALLKEESKPTEGEKQ